MPRYLDRETLRAAGIEYSKRRVSPDDFLHESPQGHTLALYLLDFKHTITQESLKDLPRLSRIRLEQEHNEMVIPQEQPREDSRRLAAFVDRYSPKDCDKLFDLASIAQRAYGIESKDEQRWSEVLEQDVFGRYIQQARRQECASTAQSAEGVLKRFRAERDHVWHFGRETLHEHCRESPLELTAPKPDLYFSFHAIGWGANELGPMGKDDYVQNFTQTKLVRLYERYGELSEEGEMLNWQFGFIPSPLAPFYTSEGIKDQQCFPWLICEWKHHGKQGTLDGKKTYCQAANAAAVCLTLFANAAATEYSGPKKHDIRPVVCMTFVGEYSRVWIAYVASVNKETARYTYKMQCIWRGNLLNTLDNVMLSIIIDRVHFWAMNHLKPWLSSCIDRWDRIVEEGLKRLNSRPKAPSSGYESTNFPLRRTATLDDFIEDDEQESDDEASYKADTEEDSDDSESEEDSDDSESEADFDDSESEGSSDEDSEQEQQVGDLRYAVRRTRSASNTPKKNNYQFPFRSKKF